MSINNCYNKDSVIKIHDESSTSKRYDKYLERYYDNSSQDVRIGTKFSNADINDYRCAKSYEKGDLKRRKQYKQLHLKNDSKFEHNSISRRDIQVVDLTSSDEIDPQDLFSSYPKKRKLQNAGHCNTRNDCNEYIKEEFKSISNYSQPITHLKQQQPEQHVEKLTIDDPKISISIRRNSKDIYEVVVDKFPAEVHHKNEIVLADSENKKESIAAKEQKRKNYFHPVKKLNTSRNKKDAANGPNCEPSNSNLNNSVHKQIKNISSNVDKFGINADTRIDVINKSAKVLCNKNPCVVLHKVEEKKYILSNNNCTLDNGAKRIHLTEKLDNQTNVKIVDNKLNQCAKKDYKTQEKKTPDDIQTSSAFNIHYNQNINTDKFIKDPVKQLKNILLLLNEKLKNNYNMFLLTEVLEPNKLIDASFCFERKNEATNRIDCSLCEVKYFFSKEYKHIPKINFKMLSGSDFNVEKYYNTYLKYRKTLSPTGVTKIIKNFTIYSNLELNDSAFKRNNITIVPGCRPNSYKLDINENNEFYDYLCRKSLYLPPLAKLIADHIVNKETVVLKGLMKKYHMALIFENIIKIRTTIKNGKKKFIGNFHPKFINGYDLSRSAIELRKYLEMHLCRPISEDMELNLSMNFGQDFIFDENPQINQLDKLASELATVISSSVTITKEKILLRKYLSLKHDIMKITGHILKKADNDTVVLTKKFLDRNFQLPGNLDQLRNIVDSKLRQKNISFSQIANCKFKINEFRDKESTNFLKALPHDNGKIIIREFFNKLEFVVQKFDDNQIHKEIGEEFELVQDESYANTVQEELLKWLKLNDYSMNPFQLLKSKISKFMIINHSLANYNSLTKIKIEFKEELLSELIHCLTDNTIGFISIKTKYILFSLKKVHQAIKCIPKYSENHGCIFIKLNVLYTESQHVFNVFKLPSIKLIVIECNEPLEKEDNIIDICSNLINIIEKSSKNNKKLLIIANTENILKNSKVNSKLIVDKCISVKHLTEDSQDELLENIVVQLHCRRLKLLDIMSKSSLQNIIKTPDMLSLIQGNFKICEDIIIPNGFVNEYYIRNEIIQQIVINFTIFKKKINDIFVIVGIEKQDFYKFLLPNEKVCYLHELDLFMQNDVRFILVDYTFNELSFIKFTEKKKRNFHLLKYESKRFIWQKSSGTISELLEYKDKNSDILYEFKSNQGLNILPETDLNPKMVIIAGDFGAGKSVYLYDLARRFCEKSSVLFWVVQINLNTINLCAYEGIEIKDNTRAVYILAELLGLDALRQKIFMMSASGKLKLRLTILFDGFDELSLNHKNFVIELLKHLQNANVNNVYVTTRLNSCAKLEKELGVFSYSLNYFTHDKKLNFLVNYWKKEVQAYGHTHELRECAENLLKAYNENLQLISCPLQLKLLAEIHKQSVRQKTLSSDFTIVHFQNTYELYNHFIRSKNINSSDYFEIQKASLKRLLSSSDFKRLDLDPGGIKIGNYIPEFDHVTFAEYFAAHWLVDQCNFELLQYIAFDCIDRLVVKTSPVFLESLTTLFSLNNHKSLQLFVNFLIQSRHVNILKILLQNSFYNDDASQKTSLHIAAETNNIQGIRILLQHFSAKERTDVVLNGDFSYLEYTNSKLSTYVNKPFRGKTALQLAANNDSVEIACDLMMAGADIMSVDKEFLQIVLLHVISELSSVSSWSHKLWTLAEKILKIVPESIEQLKNEIECSKLLNYLFAHGRIQIIKTLIDVLEKKKSRYELMSTSNEGMTPLGCVNNSIYLKDDERLEISKFLVNKIGSQLIKDNRNYLYSILEAAIKFKHPKTFEYFIDQYSGGYFGFFKFALQTNQMQILEFLVRNNERTIDPVTGNTALQTAIHLQVSPRVIKFLVDKGGINNTNNLTENILCVAIKLGVNLKLIKYLIEQGADVNAEDQTGFFPWCYAILSETTRYNKEQQLNLMHYLQTEVQSKIMIPVARCKSYLYDKWREELIKKFAFFWNPDTYNLDYVDEDGTPRLHLAVKSNDLTYINFLLDHGADANIRNSEGQAPLHIAIEYGLYDAAKLLLQNGAIFDIEDKYNRTPLDQLTDKNCKTEECKELHNLIEKISTYFSSKKFTMLLKKHLPVDKNQLDTSFLGYLMGCRDKRGRTLVHIAADRGSGDVFKQLVKFSIAYSERYPNFRRLDPDVKDFKGNTPMHLAASKGHQNFIARLTNEGACFEVQNLANETPEKLGTLSNSSKVIQLLNTLKNLFKAVKQSNLKIIKSCLDEESHLLNARDASGKMILHWAVILRDIYIAKYILRDKNSSINAADFSGRTPLHYAVEVDNIECAKALLKAGAMIDVRDKQGLRPFDLGDERNKSAEMIKAIYQLFKDVQSDVPKIVLDEQSKILTDYLSSTEHKYGIDRDIIVNARESGRNSLMHYAMKFDYVNVVVVLLKNGAVYNARNKLRQNPGDFAKSTKELYTSIDNMFTNVDIKSWNKHSQVEHEIAIRCRGIGGYTLLHVTVKSGKLEEIKWLIERGAIIDVSNNKGSGLLSHADKCNPDIAKILRKS